MEFFDYREDEDPEKLRVYDGNGVFLGHVFTVGNTAVAELYNGSNGVIRGEARNSDNAVRRALRAIREAQRKI